MDKDVKSVVFFGKGGIGKSTISSNISTILGRMGHTVLHAGCDPKMDSSLCLVGRQITPFSASNMRPDQIDISRFIVKSPYIPNVDCVEAGGPEPGIGCAGIAIGTLLDAISAEKLLVSGKYDRVVYDVLGDVVCGGFASPLKKGFAKKAVIVSSEEILSLYAANNLLKMLRNFEHNGVYPAGIVLNLRDPSGLKNALKYSEISGLPVLGILHRDKAVYEASRINKPAVLAFPSSLFAREIVRLTLAIEKATPPSTPPAPLTNAEFSSFTATENIPFETIPPSDCPHTITSYNITNCHNIAVPKKKKALTLHSLETNGISLLGANSGELLLSYTGNDETFDFRIVQADSVPENCVIYSDWGAYCCKENGIVSISTDLKNTLDKYADYSYSDFISLIAYSWKSDILSVKIAHGSVKSSKAGNIENKTIMDISKKFMTYVLPYQIGVYLGINAIKDAALLNDGPNCSIPKAEFIYGNHDINSTLFSPDGMHRIFYTMSHPIKQKGNPEYKLEAMLSVLADCGRYGIVFATGLPFQSLTGIDYEGISSSITGKIPVAAVPPKSMELDWLGGYSAVLEAAAYKLDYSVPRKKNSIAIAGYLFDRNEGDHWGNIKELKRLLAICGLDLISVFPDGNSFSGLQKAAEAEYIVSFPYSRNAASIMAMKSGAKLIETDIPIGFKATTQWLEKICLTAGRSLPESILQEEGKAKAQYNKFASVLRHKPVIFAGDPYLFDAIYIFCRELHMRPDTAFLDCYPRKVKNLPKRILFSPSTESVRNMTDSLEGYDKPAAIIGNSFSFTEKFAKDIPFVELGFPSYSFHCLLEEPFMGYAGSLCLAGRLLNAFMR